MTSRPTLLLLLLALAPTARAQLGGRIDPPRADPFAAIRPAEAGPLAVRDRELVRNGDFELGAAGWATSGLVGGSPSDAARVRGAVGYQLTASGSTVFVAQSLALPTQLSAARLRLTYRIGGGGADAALGRFAVLLAAVGGGPPTTLATLVDVRPQSYRGPAWQRVDLPLDRALLDRLQALQARRQVASLWIGLQGRAVSAHLDDVSLVVSGQQDLPRLPGTLAYAAERPGGTTLRWASPDGRQRGTLATLGGVCKGLAWRPDGRALALASTHEALFSRWTSDLYVLDGRGLTRRTNGPSHPALRASGRPTGSVRGRLENRSRRAVNVALYVQGAQTTVPLVAAPGATVDFRVDGVVDLGPAHGQYVVAHDLQIVGRSWTAATLVDVQPGGVTAMGAPLTIIGHGSDLQATAPAWRRDGIRLVFSGAGQILDLAPGAAPTRPAGWSSPMRGAFPTPSPVDDRLAYLGPGLRSVLLETPGQAQPRTLAPTQAGLLAPAWLPDGSGVLFVRGLEQDQLWLAPLPTGEPAGLLALHGERILAVRSAPDGQHAVLLLGLQGGTPATRTVMRRSLWIIRLDNPAIRWPVVTDEQPTSVDWSR